MIEASPRDIISILSLIGGILFFVFAAGELKGKIMNRVENLEKDVDRHENELNVLMTAKGLSRIKR